MGQLEDGPPDPVALLSWSASLILLEQLKDVDYLLRDVKKPIGVAEWQTRLVESLPEKLQLVW